MNESHITYFPEAKRGKKLSPVKNSFSFFTPNSKKSQFQSNSIITPSTNTEEDDFFVFGKHVANELRAVEDNFALQTMKMKINTILFEGRTGQYNSVPLDDNKSLISSNKHNTIPNITEENEGYEIIACESMPTIQ